MSHKKWQSFTYPSTGKIVPLVFSPALVLFITMPGVIGAGYVGIDQTAQGSAMGYNPGSAFPQLNNSTLETTKKPPQTDGLAPELAGLVDSQSKQTYAAENGLSMDGQSVLVVIELSSGESLPSGYNVRVTARAQMDGQTQIQGYAPVSELQSLAQEQRVAYVRAPETAVADEQQSDSSTSAGTPEANSAESNDNGNRESTPTGSSTGQSTAGNSFFGPATGIALVVVFGLAALFIYQS